jgi:hypothetical protein
VQVGGRPHPPPGPPPMRRRRARCVIVLGCFFCFAAWILRCLFPWHLMSPHILIRN